MSTLSDAMIHREPSVFGKLFNELPARCVMLTSGHGLRIHYLLFAIDSTTIAVFPNSYDWARPRTNKGAVKFHTQMDLSYYLPCYVVMSNGKMSDIHASRR